MLADFKVKIKKYLDRGESVQIIAPPGFGKSRFGRSLKGLFLDPNLLQTPDELQSTVRNSPERKLIVVDSSDQILDTNYARFFKYLKAIRNEHRGTLAYVFLASKLIGPGYLPLLGDLYEIVSEHIENLSVLEPSEYDLQGFSPTPKQLKEITHLSGGIPALVKICALAMRDGLSLDPQSNPKLKAQLEEMLAAGSNHPALTTSQLVQNYISSQPPPLSASETRILDLLTTNSGQIVSKDQICQTVYPDVKNYAGISDHAIDQLVHRLRAKIKHKYSILTHRGLGYRLTIPQ